MNCTKVTACLLALFLETSIYATEIEPPNIILILADDMATGDLSSRNAGRSKTPNLDRLARQSVWFDQAYSASCVCAPARAALLTGRYPHRTGVVTLNMNRYPQLTRLKHDETTIAEVLKAHGYATGLIGKWHCGQGKDNSPLKHGFDEFEGFSGSQDLSYFKYSLTINNKVNEVSDRYLTDDLTQRAIAFVRRHREKPFFLHLAHYAPHRPLEAPAERVAVYRRKGLDESTATIYAMIEIMDRGIGELLSELDRLKLSERTIVIFASDNGPDPLTGTRFNQNFRGTKYQIYEGGIRVPLLVRWPGKFKAGQVKEMIHFVDVFPTILELCGVKHQPTMPLDGKSFATLLTGKLRTQEAPIRRFWQWNRGTPNYSHNAAMREGDWKLIRPYVTRTVNPKDSKQPPVLFNLSSDPTEAQDLAKDHPERTATMNALLTEWSQSVEMDRVRDGNRSTQSSSKEAERIAAVEKIADYALVPPKLNTSPLPEYDYDKLDYGMTIGIERTPSGRIWACWVAGGDSPKAFFVLATSDDEGETWSKPRLVVDAHDKMLPAERSVLVGNLWTDPSGRLWLIFDQSMDMFDGRAGVWVSVCENPDAKMPKWSKPRRIWHGVTLNKPTVLSTGEWMLPISLDQRPGFRQFKGCFKELDPLRGANVFVSSDKGTTWERRGCVKFPNPDWHEHMIVERKDGTLWMLARTAKGLMQSFSSDKGKTWSEPTFPSIKHPVARFHIRRLASGRILLVKHGKTIDLHEGRSQLTAWLSDDEGKTWQGGLMLDERKGISYPDGFQAPDGTLFISYDRNRATDGEILMARFTEADILAKKLVGPKSKLKILISRPLAP
ncbi:MAG: sulfatase-like hydrolase/transferase [Planctomycetaceae bacterium]|nr:sulfatase-like hydrolase/transferase [Planctomycetaceae bacterium]